MNHFIKLILFISMPFFLTVSLLAQTDQFGVQHDPKVNSDTLIVVDFAASWCKPCLKSLPRLQELSRHYPDIQFIVISVDETVSGRDKLIQRTHLQLPVVWDVDHAWAEHYSPKGMPSLFIVEPSGKIVYAHAGFNQEKWDHFLSELKALASKN